nr:RNA-directed DNA polymerase, eukaryota [Tanacetum cinerariifolium]
MTWIAATKVVRNDEREREREKSNVKNIRSEYGCDHVVMGETEKKEIIEKKKEVGLEGFDAMVEQTWHSFSHSDVNRMIRFKKKLQDLKAIIRYWVKDKRMHRCLELQCKLHDINQMEAKDSFQKSKIKLAIVGDENSKFFHGKVKEALFNHFEAQFKKHVAHRFMLNFPSNKWLSDMQAADLGRNVSRDEIQLAVWNCGRINLLAVEYFFETGLFSKGCNSSFVALIPKVADAKFVNDFRHIILIGSVYKVVTKTLANWLAFVIANLVSDTQSVFVANRQILDGPFILNEILHWCKRKKKQAMFFKANFAKAYDSVRWDYLLDVLEAFGFGEWFDANLKGIVNILQCFFLASGLKINIHRSQLLGVGIPRSIVMQAASSIGCGVMHNQFCHLGVMVGECMSRHQAWDDTVLKLRSRLSNWNVKTLSIGGRLTLLKWVLGASLLYNMSIFKVPKGILKFMEAIRSNFFNRIDSSVKKITWAARNKILASKKNGGLGVSSFHALNRALLLKWVWRFISQDGSLWFRVIQAFYGPSIVSHPIIYRPIGALLFVNYIC